MNFFFRWGNLNGPKPHGLTTDRSSLSKGTPGTKGPAIFFFSLCMKENIWKPDSVYVIDPVLEVFIYWEGNRIKIN